MLARRDARTLLVRVPLLVVLLLPLWYVARAPLAAALVPPADLLLDATLRTGFTVMMADGPTILFAWTRPEDHAAIEQYGVPWRPAPGQAIHINLVVFLALVLATPRLVWRQRLTVLAVGLPLLYAADVLTLVAALRWQLVTDFGYLGPGAANDPWVGLAYYWPHLFLISVGNQAFGVGAWLAGLAVALRPRHPPAGHHAAGRNAPCPCGSGRKYKHCCGAAA